MNLQWDHPPKTLHLARRATHLILRVYLAAQAVAVLRQLLQVLLQQVWVATRVAAFVNRLRCAESLVSSQHTEW